MHMVGTCWRILNGMRRKDIRCGKRVRLTTRLGTDRLLMLSFELSSRPTSLIWNFLDLIQFGNGRIVATNGPVLSSSGTEVTQAEVWRIHRASVCACYSKFRARLEVWEALVISELLFHLTNSVPCQIISRKALGYDWMNKIIVC